MGIGGGPLSPEILDGRAGGVGSLVALVLGDARSVCGGDGKVVVGGGGSGAFAANSGGELLSTDDTGDWKSARTSSFAETTVFGNEMIGGAAEF